MKRMPLEKRNVTDSRLVLGCMGFGGEWDASPLEQSEVKKLREAVEAALEIGITMFDHADIYRMGKAERAFGQVMKEMPGLRERIVLQSKVGIRMKDDRLPRRYDFSKAHILQATDGILSRLGTDYLDILLLHRPDILVEPEEVAEAFAILKQSGKVRHFGVSNMNADQIRFLRAYTDEPLIVNQLEMSLARTDFVEHVVTVNQRQGAALNFSDGLIEYCRLHDVQLQAWAPLAYGMFSGAPLADDTPETVRRTRDLVTEMAREKETTPEAIVLGWLMRHPAMIQPVIGTTNPQRIRNCADAAKQAERMTREEWYMLFGATRGEW
jgi:predicted oxidoreductase